MKKFVFLEHISDAYVAAYGRSLEEAFENAALAMFEVMTDTSKVRPKHKFEVEARGFDLYSLLYDWLENLLIVYNIHNVLLSKFKLYKIRKVNEEYIAKGEAYGEPFDPLRHEQRTEVKAVTYSLMEISKKNREYEVKVVFDI